MGVPRRKPSARHPLSPPAGRTAQGPALQVQPPSFVGAQRDCRSSPQNRGLLPHDLDRPVPHRQVRPPVQPRPRPWPARTPRTPRPPAAPPGTPRSAPRPPGRGGASSGRGTRRGPPPRPAAAGASASRAPCTADGPWWVTSTSIFHPSSSARRPTRRCRPSGGSGPASGPASMPPTPPTIRPEAVEVFSSRKAGSG